MQNTQPFTNTFNACSLTFEVAYLVSCGCSAGTPVFVRNPKHCFTFSVYEIQQMLTLNRIDSRGGRFPFPRIEAAEADVVM
jgi:hypothetical protein